MGTKMSEKQYIPSSEKETWSSQVGHFSAVALGSSSQNKSITENSESENKDKSIGETKKVRTGNWWFWKRKSKDRC